MPDAVTEALKQIRVTKVQMRLSKKLVQNDVSTSGFWPRVTLERPGKIKTIPMTWYGKQIPASKRQVAISLSSLEIAILKFAGFPRNTPLNIWGRRQALLEANKKVQTAISRAMSRAASRGKTARRHQAAQRRARKITFLEKFRRFCETEGDKLEYEDLRPSDLGQIWDDVRRLKVAKSVMES